MQATQESESHGEGILSASSQSVQTGKSDDNFTINDLMDILFSSTPENKVFTCLPRGIFTPAAVEYLVETIGILPISNDELKLGLMQRQLNLRGLTLIIYDSVGGRNHAYKGWTVFNFTIKRISDDLCRLTYHLQDQQVITTDFEALSLD